VETFVGNSPRPSSSSGTSTGRPWIDRLIDLRVEDHPEPIGELRRLVTMQRAYQHMNNGDLAVEKKDIDGALREYSTAERMVPDNLEMKYWHAVALVNAGRLDESLPIFKTIFLKDFNWRELTPRLPAVKLLDVDAKGLQKILSVVPDR
jgi:hypothetical protein